MKHPLAALSKLRANLTYANVMATLAVFIALGGTALASVIIGSNSQVAKDTISGHQAPSGKHPNIIAGSISGKDIANRSGVETCKTPLVKKFGPICAGSDGVARNWPDAVNQCGSLGLRLPSVSEAITLATNSDVPGVSDIEFFWTDGEFNNNNGGINNAFIVKESGNSGFDAVTGLDQTVCVTDPSA
jgi:hypothetical protein